MLSINILESDSEIVSRIMNSYASVIDDRFRGRVNRIISAIKPVISTALQSSPEIQSLSGGILKADFGLTSDPSQQIISAIVNTVNVQIQNVRSNGSNISGGLRITAQPSDHANLLSLPVATQAIKSGSLPWLKWLLTLGDTIIIGNFGVEYGPYGRSGRGKMTANNRPFKVNSAFSGTADDNFITRAMERNKSAIENAIIGAIE